MNDSMHARKTTTTIERMQAMYDYSRHQEVAKMESEKATKRMTYLWICIGLILLLLLIVTICMLVLRDMRVKRKLVEAEYRRSIETINQAKKELSLLQLYKELNAQLIENKQQLIREQNAIKKALLQKSKKNQNDAMIHFKSLPIFDVFTKCMNKGKNPTRTEWADFQDAIFNSYPGFSEFMQKHNEKLTDREFKICVLIRADFKPVSIGNVLGIAASSITQIRSDLHQKLFKEPGNSKDFDNHIKRIF